MSHPRTSRLEFLFHLDSSNVLLFRSQVELQDPNLKAALHLSKPGAKAPDPSETVPVQEVQGVDPVEWPVAMIPAGANPPPLVLKAIEREEWDAAEDDIWYAILPAGVVAMDPGESIHQMTEVVDGGPLAARKFWRPARTVR